MADLTDPDCGPKPPDDPAANRWTRRPYRFSNNLYWDRISDGPAIDQGAWQEYLPIDESGTVKVDRARAMELALLHSREYQDQVELVYLSALALSGNRFEFDANWFGNSSIDYDAAGEPPFGSRTLSQSNLLGFTQNLAAGGEFAASLANSFVWQVDGTGASAAGSSIVFSLTQPFLRGAYRHVRLESLTQAERTLLYQVREFAHFRRDFYLDVTTSYLNLLAQAQSLRNQQSNLESLELNLREHQELFDRQMVAQIQVDQVFQDYQSGRIAYLAAEQSFANSLDNFKFQLGLPPRIEIEIDETLLSPFELSDPRLDQLQLDAEQLYQDLIQYLPPDAPPRDVLLEIFERYARQLDLLKELLPRVEGELEQWQANLEQPSPFGNSEETEIDRQQQRQLMERVVTGLQELRNDLKTDSDNRADQLQQVQELPLAEAWQLMSRQIGRVFREQVATLFIAQNQIRLFLIDVIPFQLEQQAAVDMALANRLDLMNQRARVADAFRQVEVAADALESDFSMTADATIQTDPDRLNPVRFDSSANNYSIGFQLDGPLNRFAERNAYRAAQLDFQQSRRQYMASEDAIVNQIRADLRRVRISWLNFQISRQQLIAATRQVDETQFQIRTTTTGDLSLTQNLLLALQTLLNAKNNLISSWIDYEVGRIQLFVDLELLYLDPNGNWLNERFNPGRPADQPSSDNRLDDDLPDDGQSNASSANGGTDANGYFDVDLPDRTTVRADKGEPDEAHHR